LLSNREAIQICCRIEGFIHCYCPPFLKVEPRTPDPRTTYPPSFMNCPSGKRRVTLSFVSATIHRDDGWKFCRYLPQ
jgi:hypothetical protein